MDVKSTMRPAVAEQDRVRREAEERANQILEYELAAQEAEESGSPILSERERRFVEAMLAGHVSQNLRLMCSKKIQPELQAFRESQKIQDARAKKTTKVV